MNKIIIQGGKPLRGEITVSGSKNAALPIIFSCILTRGVSKIENIPDIGDVRVALEILSDFGARITREGNFVTINTEKLAYVMPKSELVSEIRASTYLIGACLSRFGICHIQPFGGCCFAHRPIDMHLAACRTLGADLFDNELRADQLSGGQIIFDKPSVGATVNAILLSVCAEGDSRISGCAIEPHIDSLINFINSCGASINRQGRDIYVSGRRLHGGQIRIIGDMIEAGSYLSAGIITNGEVSVSDCPIEDMSATISAFRSLGAEITIHQSSISASMRGQGRFFRIKSTPYPGFPTDLQPIFAPLMAKFSGGEITDNVWTTRFGYFNSLANFGIEAKTIGNTATVQRSDIHNGKATAPDLRGAFACLLTALSADGTSEIYSPEIILRGYENLETKLRALGAMITINQDEI